uniref:C2H2-type domain-containing protein n=1 Tax=Strongyloides venezuelensis TaxID=75913 RepID=A0A0K0FJS5_STRVS
MDFRNYPIVSCNCQSFFRGRSLFRMHIKTLNSCCKDMKFFSCRQRLIEEGENICLFSGNLNSFLKHMYNSHLKKAIDEDKLRHINETINVSNDTIEDVNIPNELELDNNLMNYEEADVQSVNVEKELLKVFIEIVGNRIQHDHMSRISNDIMKILNFISIHDSDLTRSMPFFGQISTRHNPECVEKPVLYNASTYIKPENVDSDNNDTSEIVEYIDLNEKLKIYSFSMVDWMHRMLKCNNYLILKNLRVNEFSKNNRIQSFFDGK